MASILTTIPGLSSLYPGNPAWKLWREDFVQIPEVTTYWTHTQTNGTLGVGANGMTQTLAGADNDCSQMQLAQGTLALVAAKKAVFEAKIKIEKGSGGTEGLQELILGLSTVQATTNLVAADGSALAVDNMIGFWSGPTAATVAAVVRKADVQSINSACTSYTDATSVILSMYFNGTSVAFYADGTEVARLYAYPTAVLSPVFYIRAGEGKAAVLTTAYAIAAVER